MNRIDLSPDQQRGHALLRGALHDLVTAAAGVGLGNLRDTRAPAADVLVKVAAAVPLLWPEKCSTSPAPPPKPRRIRSRPS